MEHLYVITYDIADDRRWRRVFKTMRAYGEWLQLSVFQCRLDRTRLLQMESALNESIHHEEDHVLILDLGPVEGVKLQVRSLGKRFDILRREPMIF